MIKIIDNKDGTRYYSVRYYYKTENTFLGTEWSTARWKESANTEKNNSTKFVIYIHNQTFM